MPDSRLPRPGDRFRATLDAPVRIWISYAAPGSGSAEAVLPKGEVVEIQSVPPGAGWTFARPDRAELESILVPKADLEWPTYGGYSVVIQLQQLDSDFELISRTA